MHTLLDFHFRPHARAGNGKIGQGANRSGAAGETLELRVPDGTVVMTEDGEVLADLIGPGTTFVAAQGGRGGLGNAALASKARKAPGFALLGEPGESRDLVLELRSVADVGLVGFPSAGKSSLISVMSAAKPKIADYPFTTLVPNLGVITAGDTVFTMADVPGLIPGASEGKGLGLDFLRHIERCAVLVHVVDCATYEPGRDPVSDVDALEAELARYTPSLGGELADRPRVVVLNKVDVPEAAELAEFVRPELEERGLQVFEISAASRKGLRELTYALGAVVERYRADAAGAGAGEGRAAAAGRGRQRVHRRDRSRGGGRLHRARHPPGAVDPADELRQRRGGRLSRRPAATGSGSRRRWPAGRRAGQPGHHRRRLVRVGAVDAGPGSRCTCPGAVPTCGWRTPIGSAPPSARKPAASGVTARTRSTVRAGRRVTDDPGAIAGAAAWWSRSVRRR